MTGAPVPRDLCLALMRAECEEEVISVLKAAGYWDNPAQWRYYGDNPLNWSQAGGQQSRTDFALTEKVVNAIDSVLTRCAIERGIKPDGPDAPSTIREAVAAFFEEVKPGTANARAGHVEEWTKSQRTEVAQNISVFTTEPQGWSSARRPTVSIADLGEGHVPAAFPTTFVSLGRSNKVRIGFVQGKFCQGGTGALRFCGEHSLQLVVSRRHPKLVGSAAGPDDYPSDPDTDGHWGFTVVRREKAGPGERMSSYTYLAPLGAAETPRRGKVLHFPSPTMPLFPKGVAPYQRETEWGTLIKLYEYKVPNSANIIRRDGLMQRLNLLLPDPALPVRMHECRERAAGSGSSEQTNTMAGLFARLHDQTNLEPLSPSSATITVNGRQLTMRIFAFKPGTSDTYRGGEGVVFTVNGQAHAYMKAAFFGRKNVGLQRLARDLLVYIDCSNLGPNELEDAFMSSRDRLVEDNTFAKEIEKRIEDELSDHHGLRELKRERLAADLKEKLADSKPLEDALKKVLRSSPTLALLFGTGVRLQNPLDAAPTGRSRTKFKGKRHPTFFRFANRGDGQSLDRDAHIGNRVRLRFETDAVDDYFMRAIEPGEFRFEWVRSDGHVAVENFSGPTLKDGGATVTFYLPDGATPGDSFAVELVVIDQVLGREWRNRANLLVKPGKPDAGTPPGKARPPGPPDKPGQNGQAGIALPRVVWLKKKEAKWSEHFAHDDDCLDAVDDADGASRDRDYTFYLNGDNRALRYELANNRKLGSAAKKQFEVAITLVGLAVLHDGTRTETVPETKEGESEETTADRVKRMSRAIAPVLLPMINSLSDIGQFEEDSDLLGQAA